MAKAIIVYATRTGETETIGNLIAEGLRMKGHEVDVKKINEINSEADLEGYDAYVFGSATYHGDMIQGMKTFLFMAEKAPLEGKIGGAFGAFGWSGEASDRIFETMQHIFKMKMVGSALRLKSASLGGGQQMAQGYGTQLAELLAG
jgi:flavorubredoxin